MSNKILVIRLGAIGDVIRTMPVLECIKKKYPNSKIDWLVEDRASNILQDSSLINEIISIPRSKINLLLKEKKYFSLFSLIKNLISYIRSKKYLIVYDFHGILKSGLLSFFSNAPVRVGYSRKYSKEFNYLFNNKLYPLSEGPVMRIAKNFYLLGMNLSDKAKLSWNIHIPESDKTYIHRFLKDNNLIDKKIIAVSPFVSLAGRYKEWFAENYAELINMILSKYSDYEVVITSGPGEEEKLQNLLSMIKYKVYPLPSKNLKQLAYMISIVDFIITGDTASMHLADAFNTDIVAVFGPSDVNVTKPFNSYNIVIIKDSGCNPCRNKKCSHLKCLKILTPEYVFDEIVSFRKSRGKL